MRVTSSSYCLRVPFTTVSKIRPHENDSIPKNMNATAKSALGIFGTSPVWANSQITGTPNKRPTTHSRSPRSENNASGR